MKRNLFAIFLAVMVVAALVLVIAPSAKAETSDMLTATAEEKNFSVTENGKTLDLKGQKDVTVDIAAGITLSVIDTANTEMDGSTAGSLTKTGEGSIASVAFDGNSRYLAVEDGGTYTFHPFYLSVTAIGLNTITSDICLRVSFGANDIARGKISDYGIEKLTGATTGEVSAKDHYAFGDKNGIHAYYDLDGSLANDKLDLENKYQAYMVIGGVKVVSNYVADIAPRQVLKGINNAEIVAKATDTQKAAIAELATNNAHLADLFTAFTGADCAHSAKAGATCLAPETCKNCDETLSAVADHTDGDDAGTECDVCAKELSDYKELDATELASYKTGTTDAYTSQGTIFGRDNVYGAGFLSNWSVEVVAKNTAANSKMPVGSEFAYWSDVRNNLKTKGYQYIAVDFALAESASITAIGSLPPATAGGDSITSGLKFTADGTLSWSSLVTTDEQKAFFHVYSNGKEISVGDKINAGQWYTVVIKLLTDVTGYGQGESSYSSVAFGGGSSTGAMVYFSGVRYYTNDTYTEDYVYETVLPDYDEKDATELVENKTKTQNVYSNQGTILGRDNVYGATFLANWNVEIVAKATVSTALYADSAFSYWPDVRANYEAQGYEYAAIDFALSEGATIRAIGCLPPAAEGEKVVTAGLTFTDGKALAWGGSITTDEQKAFFTVYSNGKEVKIGDTIKAGQWYTVVIKLLKDVTGTKDGDASWSNVAFNVGNGKMVYFSDVRYYRNDSYKTDYVYETVLPDYDEKDGTEMVVYKSKDASKNDVVNYDQKNISIYDRTNVYGVTFPTNSWNFALAAKSTIPQTLYANSAFADWNAVRSNYAANGYQYIAIDFALEKGSSINVTGSVLPIGNAYGTAYLTFADNSALAWRKTDYTDEQKSYFAVYSEGKEVQVGDTIHAGQWYTVVVKLLTEVDTSSRYSSVGFELGNGKMVYFSGVRYYRNDSYKTDFVQAN